MSKIFIFLSLIFVIARAQQPSAPGVPAEVPVASPEMHVTEVLTSPGSETFSYDPVGKRDPFQPESDKESDVPEDISGQGKRMPTPAPLPQRELEPLELFDLTQLKISAIIWDTKKPRAMLTDPSGASHIVKLKSRIGKKNGFVVSIREGEVVVVEYDAELDQWVKSFKVLELR